MSGVVIGGGNVGNPVPPVIVAPSASPVPGLLEDLPDNIEVWPSGRALIQDTTNFDSTGRPYKIRTMDIVYWKIGKDDRGFNWPRYTLVESYTDNKPGERAEHVGDTVRLDKHGTATAFGRVTEMNDFCGKGPMVAHEEDMRIMATVSDADAQDNGNRIVHDVIVAGSTEVNDPQREVGATAALRTSGANPLAYWSFGVWLRAIRGMGVQVESWIHGGIRMFSGIGTWQLGLDTSGAHLVTGEAVRMAPGQAISFEPTGCRKVRYKAWTGDGMGDRWQFMNGDVPVFEIDGDGNIYKRGVKVL